MSTREALLSASLEVAVPLWIDRMRDYSAAYRIERAQECADVIASKGDIIMYRSKKRGETGRAFNRLAEGLACLAFVPGGVRFMGIHWEAIVE